MFIHAQCCYLGFCNFKGIRIACIYTLDKDCVINHIRRRFPAAVDKKERFMLSGGRIKFFTQLWFSFIFPLVFVVPNEAFVNFDVVCITVKIYAIISLYFTKIKHWQNIDFLNNFIKHIFPNISHILPCM